MAWSSFDKHFVQSPKAFFQPNDKGELLEIVRQAREEVRKPRDCALIGGKNTSPTDGGFDATLPIPLRITR